MVGTTEGRGLGTIVGIAEGLGVGRSLGTAVRVGLLLGASEGATVPIVLGGFEDRRREGVGVPSIGVDATEGKGLPCAYDGRIDGLSVPIL